MARIVAELESGSGRLTVQMGWLMPLFSARGRLGRQERRSKLHLADGLEWAKGSVGVGIVSSGCGRRGVSRFTVGAGQGMVQEKGPRPANPMARFLLKTPHFPDSIPPAIKGSPGHEIWLRFEERIEYRVLYSVYLRRHLSNESAALRSPPFPSQPNADSLHLHLHILPRSPWIRLGHYRAISSGVHNILSSFPYFQLVLWLHRRLCSCWRGIDKVNWSTWFRRALQSASSLCRGLRGFSNSEHPRTWPSVFAAQIHPLPQLHAKVVVIACGVEGG